MRKRMIQINKADNVGVALSPIGAGEEVTFGETSIIALEDIPQGHKMALEDIEEGENVIKYGHSIGHSVSKITKGNWVHTHNMMTNLSGEIEYEYNPTENSFKTEKTSRNFMGYRRKTGEAATRNEVWILPTVGCVNEVAQELVKKNQDLVGGNVEGIYAFTHPFGCSQTGEDHAQTRKLLAALAKHPNAGAVLVLSLGCENLTHEQFLED